MPDRNTPRSDGASIIPCLRYRDAHDAIDWLCAAFSLHRHAVYTDAQLTWDKGMTMLGAVRDSGEWSDCIAQREQIGDREIQSPCVIVRDADADAHYARATADGAEIVEDIADQCYGGRAYSCRDPEGHLWWFGSYDPWAAA